MPWDEAGQAVCFLLLNVDNRRPAHDSADNFAYAHQEFAMLFDAISSIVFAFELLLVGSRFDAVPTHRPLQRVVVLLPNPHFVWLIEGCGSYLPEGTVSLRAEQQKVPSLDFSRGGMS